MATKIRGITVEIGGDASGLEKALSGVNSKAKSVQKELKDVERLLKLDPKNTELLAQKQKLLAENVSTAKEKLEALNQAQEQMKTGGVDKNSEQYRALQREIVSTEQSLKKAEKAAKEFGSVNLQKLKTNLQEVSTKAKQVQESTKAISAAGAAVAGGLIASAVSAGNSADELNTLAKQYNITTAEIQKMNYAQGIVDVSTEDMLASYSKLTKTMAAAGKSADYSSTSLGKLGVNIKNTDGSMRNANDVWCDTLEALSKVGNETERDQISMEIFGKSAMSLAGIVDDGGESLKKLGDEAENAGLILSQDAVDGANKFHDALDKVKATAQQAFLESGADLAETLIPALEKLVDVVSRALKWFGNLPGGVQAAILVIALLVAAISPVAGIISTITGAAAALNVACLPMLGTIALIIAAVAAVIAIGVTLYKHWDEIKAKVVELKDKVVGKFNEIKDGITDKVNAIKQKVSDTFAAVKYAITHPIETARDFVKAQIDKIRSFFNFSWSLPKLKMPHFSIVGKFSLNPPQIPHIGVEWYAKAMQNGMIMNKPTVFGMNGNSLMAGGEAGSEVVVGTNSLMNMIKKAAGGKNITMNVYGAQGQDVSQLADIVMEKIKFATDRRAAVFG